MKKNSHWRDNTKVRTTPGTDCILLHGTRSGCIKPVAAATILGKCHPFTLGHPVTVHISHELEILLNQYATQALSLQWTHR